MIIKLVENELEANICDKLLTQLILDERNYNDNIDENFKVKDYYKNYINKDDSKLYIALDNEEIVGFIFAKILNDDSERKSIVKIDALYVKGEYRNRGIASKLISKIKEWIKEKDINEITINVIYENEVAKHLYYKEGFKDFCITMKYND